MAGAAPPSAREYVVAGGGPSGLSAAHRLQAAGHRVRVLEASGRAGSKMCTEHHDGFVMDRAAIFVTIGYDRLLAVAREVGSAGSLVPGGSVFGLARDGAIHEIDGTRPLRAFAATSYLSTTQKLIAGAVLAREVWRCSSAPGRPR